MISHRFIRTAVAYFVAGVALGIYMGAGQDFRFTHVHAHLNLLGWVALGLAGLLYDRFPQLTRGPLAEAHYWLHSVGLAVFMAAFAWSSISGTFAIAGVAGGASAVGLGVLLFALNVFTRLGRSAA
jgi:hypothetical protein